MTGGVQGVGGAPLMEEADARRLTDRIKLLLSTVNDQMDKLARLLDEVGDGGAR